MHDRKALLELDGVVQPAPAPRLGRTAAAIQGPPAAPGQHTVEILREYGFAEEIDALLADGVVR